MREFAQGQFRLRAAPRPLRLVYGAFLTLAALGVLSQIGFQVGRIGLTPRAIALYYRGGETANVMAFPKTFGQLLEVSHAHAFMMAVIFLILAHLSIATGAPPWFKTIVLSVTFGGMLSDLGAPWLVRYGAAWCAWIELAAWLAEVAGSAILAAVSAWECFGAHRVSSRDEGT